MVPRRACSASGRMRCTRSYTGWKRRHVHVGGMGAFAMYGDLVCAGPARTPHDRTAPLTPVPISDSYAVRVLDVGRRIVAHTTRAYATLLEL